MPTFRATVLDADGVVVDIGLASEVLARHPFDPVVSQSRRRAHLAGVNTTTERLCSVIGERLATAARDGGLGRGGSQLTCDRRDAARVAYRLGIVRGRPVTGPAGTRVNFVVPEGIDDPRASERRERVRPARTGRIGGARVGCADAAVGPDAGGRPAPACLPGLRARRWAGRRSLAGRDRGGGGSPAHRGSRTHGVVRVSRTPIRTWWMASVERSGARDA